MTLHFAPLLMVAALLVATPSVAQPNRLPEPLLAAVKKAITNNPEVQARWHEFLAADADKDNAAAGLQPKWDLNAKAALSRFRDSNGNRREDYAYGGAELVRLSTLFDGGFTAAEVKRMGYAKLTRYFEVMEAVESMALQTMQAYADVVRQAELVEEARKNFAEHTQLTQLLEERAEAGVSRRVDLEQANGRLALAESNLITEVSNLHDVSQRYLRLVGESPKQGMPSLPETYQFKAMPARAVDALQEGLAANFGINAAYENVRSRAANIDSQNAAFSPRLDFRASQSLDRGQSGGTPDARPVDSKLELIFNLPLYRGGADDARKRQAHEMKYQARDLQEKACREARLTLAVAHNEYVRVAEQLKLLAQHRLSTEKILVAYRQQFEIGQRTLMDMLNTQNEYFEASRSYINANYKYIMAQATTLANMSRLTATLGVTREGVPAAKDVGVDRDKLGVAELCPFEAVQLVDLEELTKVEPLPKKTPPPPPAAAPTPEPPVAPVPNRVTLSSDALFDEGSAVLKSQGESALADLITQHRDGALENILAVGHTDSKGSDAYNQKLSERRAHAVKEFLVSKGVDPDKISTEGRGESQPVASNETPEGRAQNRRVELLLNGITLKKAN